MLTQEVAMLPLVFVALAFATTQQAAAPAQAALSGIVVEAGNHTPVAGAQVTLVSIRLRPLPGRPVELPAATTDRSGRFRFDALEPGRYRVTVQKAGFVMSPGIALTEVTLNAGERKPDVTIAIERGAAIVGHVLDESGEPVADANVMAWRKPKIPNGVPVPARLGLVPAGAAAQTNDLGEFRLYGLASGDVYVQATVRSGFGRPASPQGMVSLPTFFPGTSDPEAAMTVSLAAGQTSGEITIRMLSAPAFQVSGVVTDDDGRPVENALVRLIVERTAGEPPLLMMGRGLQTARTDASGRFAINGVVSGPYTLLAIAPVVLSTRDGRPGASGGASMSFSSGTVTAGVASGLVGGGVTTETVNGVTTQFRDDAATRVPVKVNDANVAGLAVTVRAAER